MCSSDIRVKSSRMRITCKLANCGWTKKKTKPKFQLGRFLWKARVKMEKEHASLLAICIKNAKVNPLYGIWYCCVYILYCHHNTSTWNRIRVLLQWTDQVCFFLLCHYYTMVVCFNVSWISTITELWLLPFEYKLQLHLRFLLLKSYVVIMQIWRNHYECSPD